MRNGESLRQLSMAIGFGPERSGAERSGAANLPRWSHGANGSSRRSHPDEVRGRGLAHTQVSCFSDDVERQLLGDDEDKTNGVRSALPS